MPKLHLVGLTADNRGLMLSEHARAKRGDLVLEINDALLDAIGRAERLRRQEEGERLESAALPTKRDELTGTASGGRLSPREIQHRLRMGETVAGLAKSSGLDEAWIERFAAPVLAELDRLVERAKTMVYSRLRAGPSAMPLGQAVTANVLDKGVTLTLEEIDAGWGAHQRSGGVWCVTFTYSFKGRRHTAEWDVDPAASELTARNKLAGELAYRESDRPRREPAPAAAASQREAPAKKPDARPQGPAKKAAGDKRPAKKAAGDKGPAKKAPRKPAATKSPTTPRSDEGPGPVRQSLPGTSTEPPAGGTPGEPPAAPEPEPPSTSEPEPPSTSEPEPPSTSEPAPPSTSEPAPPSTSEPEPPPAPPSPEGPPPRPGPEASTTGTTAAEAARRVSMARPPSPAPTPPAPRHEVTPPTRSAPRVVTGGHPSPPETDAQPRLPETETAEPDPTDRTRRTDPLGRRALFSQRGPGQVEERAEAAAVRDPETEAETGGQAAGSSREAPAEKPAKKTAGKKAPARKAPAKKSTSTGDTAKPAPPPAESSPAPSGPAPSGDQDKGPGGNGPLNLSRSAQAPEPPAS